MLESPRTGVPDSGSSFIDPRGNNRSEIADLFATVLDLVIDNASSTSMRSVSPRVETYRGFANIPDQPLPTQQILERIAFLLRQPRNLAHPGCIGNMESMPTTLSTETVSTPRLEIGAGPDCDGQVLVLNDLLGLSFQRPAKFVRST